MALRWNKWAGGIDLEDYPCYLHMKLSKCFKKCVIALVTGGVVNLC